MLEPAPFSKDSILQSAFSPQTSRELGNYVYALIDPREDGDHTKRIFYIGKGQGQRCFAHATLASGSNDFPPTRDGRDLKRDLIREIIDAGQHPQVEIVAHGLDSADHALQLEAVLIHVFGLSNKQSGHHADKYWQSANQLEQRYGTPVLRSEIPGNVLLVGLHESYRINARDQDELAYSTLGDWGIYRAKAQKVDYIIGVYRGLMVSFFKTKKESGVAKLWQTNEHDRSKRARRRYRWEADPAPILKDKYMHRALVADDDPNMSLTTLPKRAAVRYLPDIVGDEPRSA